MLLGLAAITGCGGAQPVTDTHGTAVVFVEGAPDGAVVFVDDVPTATLAGEYTHFAATAGRHRLRIEAAGYLPERREVHLAGGEAYDLSVQLWPCFPEVDAECSAGPALPVEPPSQNVDPQHSSD